MSIILFYDTETSGLVNKHKKLSDNCQPHCLQIGAALYDSQIDKVLNQISVVIDCQDASIDEKALSVHGISKEHMMKYGISQQTAIALFIDMAACADEFSGYNVDFDRSIISSGMFKVGHDRDVVKEFYERPHYDVMKPLTEICKIDGKYGYKWPKLTEAYEMLIDGNGFDNDHDAFADITATIELWKYCMDNKIELEKV